MSDSSLVFTNARVIDGTGAPTIAGATIVVAADKILDIGTDVEVPAGADVVDLNGKTVVPGLIDAHVHLGGLGFTSRPSFGGSAATDHYSVPRTTALRHGVTTQRSLGDFLHDSIRLREDVASGSVAGSRLVTSGPSFQVEGGHPNATVWGGDPTVVREAARMPRTRSEAEQMVGELAEVGVDLIKIIISNNAIMGPPRPELKMPWHLVEAIVTAAHDADLVVAAHTEEVADAREAVEYGVDDIEHLLMHDPEQLDDRAVEQLFTLMAERGTYLVPTMVAHHNRGATPETDPRNFKYGNSIVKRAFESGVRIAVGSDAHTAGMHGWNLRNELVMMVHDQGIAPLAAISAATKTNAELLGVADRFGTVEAGKVADLLIVSGDPVLDITAIGNVELVVQNGRVVVDTSVPASRT